eukprot:gene9411-14593_t
MPALYVMIPAALLIVAIAIYIFFWAVDSGQYDDLDGPAHSVLFDDQDPNHLAAIRPMLELAPLLVSAVILGLLGGGHCLGMCGGLMGALTLAIPKEQRSRRFRLLLAYNLGRILSYATAGLLIGLAGWAVANSPAAMFMRILAGLLLICMGLYLAGWWSGLTRIESLGRGLWRHIQPVANRLLPVSSLPRALLLGALWGWLPCGLVYSTLLWAASQGNALDSAVLMLAFGLGTWPVLLATGLAADRVTALLRKRSVRMAGGLLVMLFGIWTLPGPHQHWLMGH